MKNLQWVLARRPVEHVEPSDFRLEESPVGAPSLAPGQVLVRNVLFGIAPTLRNWLNDPANSYVGSVAIGDPIRGAAICEVLRSNSAAWPPGTRLMTISRWQQYSVLNLDQPDILAIRIPGHMHASEALGIYGFNSLTAYVGVLNVLQPSPGETLVVSGAAGSVGSVAAQIGRIAGCRVIGIAGGPDKCAWLTSECGIDATIDYKSENVSERLAALCPDGVNAFFDNVGGAILQAVVDNIARRARIAVCGQISAYDSSAVAPGPRDMMKIVYWSVRIQGFLLGDFPEEFANAHRDLMRWVAEGKLHHREDVRRGFQNLPSALLDIFSGKNQGTLMVEA